MALKDAIQNKALKSEVQNRALVSPSSKDCPYVFLEPFTFGGIGFGSHLSVDLDVLEEAIAKENLIERGIVKLKD